ncbi:MAG: glycerophosphodiester phosphodiesterase family protein, partial [Burkholderiaceae bacterium]
MPLHRFLALALCTLALTTHGFELQGHRGARGLMPENTLAAFERALEIGVSTLELDIAITADGVPVISHDTALNPALTRDAQGQWIKAPGPLIKSLTLEQLQAFDVGRLDPASAYGREFPLQQARDGQRVPTLAALFKLVKEQSADSVQFAIETKLHPGRPDDTLGPQAFVEVLLKVIREAGMTQRVRIISFDWRTLQLVQKLEPAMETVCITLESAQGTNLGNRTMMAGLLLRDFPSAAHMVKASGGAVWSPNFASID